MNRVNALAISILVLAAIFYYILNFTYSQKPSDIRYLDKEIAKLNEQLITAQILANKLDRVYTLFESNLALSEQDSLADDASIPFLNSLTTTLDSLGIQLLNIRPKPRSERRNRIETPYDLEILCNYKQFGNLMAELERSPRLIMVKEYVVKNGVERMKNTRDARLLQQQEIELKLLTLTLVKGG